MCRLRTIRDAGEQPEHARCPRPRRGSGGESATRAASRAGRSPRTRSGGCRAAWASIALPRRCRMRFSAPTKTTSCCFAARPRRSSTRGSKPIRKYSAATPSCAEPLDEMRERGEEEVEHPQPLVRRRLARDLARDERAAPAQRRHRLVGEDVKVLEVDDVRREVLDLREQDRPLRRVLSRPCSRAHARLQRLAVDDHLVGVVAERPEVVRVGVGGAEERVHQRSPLLRVRPLGEARTSPRSALRRNAA